MVKLIDIANAAGVSKAAVSYAFSADPLKRAKLSPATLERILQTALKFNYRPSMIGRAFSMRKSFSIALLLPSHCAFNISYHNLGMFHGVSTAVAGSDYNLLIFFGCQERFLADLAQHRFDGVVMVSKLENASVIEQVAACDVPLVLLGRSFAPRKNLGAVGSDFAAFIRKCQTFFAQRSVRRIRLYSLQEAGLAVDAELRRACADSGYDVEFCDINDFRPPDASVEGLIFRGKTPAVEEFLLNDQRPAALWSGAPLLRPELLQYYHDSFAIGRQGVALLFEMIDDCRSGECILQSGVRVEKSRNNARYYKIDF